MRIGESIEDINEQLFTQMYTKCYTGIVSSVGREIWGDLNVIMWDELVNKVGAISDNIYIRWTRHGIR